MKNQIGAVPPADPLYAASLRPVASSPAPEAPIAELSNSRLVIEQIGQSGTYVYKTLDRITGKVLQQYPREELVKMVEGAQYAAGDVIKTKA